MNADNHESSTMDLAFTENRHPWRLAAYLETQQLCLLNSHVSAHRLSLQRASLSRVVALALALANADCLGVSILRCLLLGRAKTRRGFPQVVHVLKLVLRLEFVVLLPSK